MMGDSVLMTGSLTLESDFKKLMIRLSPVSHSSEKRNSWREREKNRKLFVDLDVVISIS